jgi:hypothetical protein
VGSLEGLPGGDGGLGPGLVEGPLEEVPHEVQAVRLVVELNIDPDEVSFDGAALVFP